MFDNGTHSTDLVKIQMLFTVCLQTLYGYLYIYMLIFEI